MLQVIREIIRNQCEGFYSLVGLEPNRSGMRLFESWEQPKDPCVIRVKLFQLCLFCPGLLFV